MFAPYDYDSHNNEELSLALANRSAALFHLKKYRECLADIDLALQYGYPAKSRPKLILRKSSCEQELAKLISNNVMETDEVSTVQTTASDADQLHESRNQLEPFVVAPRNEQSGRGLIASRDIRKGELILTEKAYVAILDKRHYKTHCYHCFKKLDVRPMACRQCSQISYCSKQCADESWTSYHDKECCFLDVFMIREDFQYPPKMAMRILLKNGIGNCLSQLPHLDDTTIPRVGYPAMHSLVTHEKDDKNDYNGASALLMAFLLETRSDDEIISTGAQSFLNNLIIKHLQQTNVNGITITDKLIDPQAPKDDPLLTEDDIGCGIYLTARLLNHSCSPNVAISCFDGVTLIMHALRDIKVSEELYHCYGTHHKWQLKSKRQKLLSESYYFKCSCSACEANLQPLTKALKCNKCDGGVVADGSLVCMNCKSIDHLDVQKIITETETGLKMLKLGNGYVEKAESDKSKYLLAEQAYKEALVIYSTVLFAVNKEITTVVKKLRHCAIKTSKYDEAVEYSKQLLQTIVFEYDERDYRVFNALMQLINCQKSLYLSVKAKTPVDKNKLNLLKTELLLNLDKIDELRNLILRRGSQECSSFAQRLSVIRKLL